MANDSIEQILPIIRSLEGLECWYTSCGGAAGSTFQLALGEKIHRDVPLKNQAHSEEYRQIEGSANLLVWCVWRLDDPVGPLTSWDDREQSFKTGLEKLIGSHITSINIMPPAWDMEIQFSNSLCLRVFCDHVPEKPSFDGNWDLRMGNITLAVGPGVKYTIEER